MCASVNVVPRIEPVEGSAEIGGKGKPGKVKYRPISECVLRALCCALAVGTEQTLVDRLGRPVCHWLGKLPFVTLLLSSPLAHFPVHRAKFQTGRSLRHYSASVIAD